MIVIMILTAMVVVMVMVMTVQVLIVMIIKIKPYKTGFFFISIITHCCQTREDTEVKPNIYLTSRVSYS